MRKIAFLAFLFLAAAGQVFADSVLLEATEDGHVRSDGNVPPAQKLLVYNNGTLQIESYIKFDLSEYENITSATLKLVIGGHSATGKNALWSVGLAENNWTESSLTWSGRPAAISSVLATLGPNIGGITSSSAIWMESNNTVKAPVTIPLNVALLQQRLATGNSVITLRIYMTQTISSGGELDMASKETDGNFGNPPRTDLTGCGPKLEVEGTLKTNIVTLSSLKIDGEVIGGFSPGKTNYAVTLAEDASAYPTIVPTATAGAASISAIDYNPVTYNPEGENTATFTVTNGGNSATYSLVFTNDKISAVFRTIIGRIQAENEGSYDVATLATAVAGYLTKFNASTGRFSDINYSATDGRIETWDPLKHLDRLKDMAFAYTMPGSEYFESDDLYDKFVLALNVWANGTFTCDNWWYLDLPGQQRLGITLLQMKKGKKQAPAATESKLITNYMKPGWNRGSGYFSGANKVDYCTHWLYSACLIKDIKILVDAIDGVFSPMVFTTGEGLQHDYSYFQHGNQLYIGGYGDELIKGNTLIASYVAGTGFDMPEERMNLLSNFMRQTWLPSIRGKYLFWNVTGRGMTRQPSNLNKSGAAATYTQRMVSIDPAHADEFAAAAKRLKGEEPAGYNVTPQSTLFYRGDYALHVRPKYSVDVRLLSSRTKTIEFGNNENLKNFYLSDGSMDIATHGHEYDGIFAVWDWTRIPGVTTPQRPFSPEHVPAGFVPATDGSSNPYTPHGTNMGGTGTSTFAGGVSDSTYTVAAYDYSAATTGVGGKKGWFFFDDEVVCLGAGINSNASVASYDIFTTLNQAHLNGDVLVSAVGDAAVAPSILPAQTAQTYPTAPNWIWHDGVGYLFPKGGNVGVSNKTQSGSWYDIDLSQSKNTVSSDVFTLYLNHGKEVTDGTYAYIIAPGKTAEETAAYAMRDDIEIVANTDSLQVVYHKGKNIWSLIFYKGCSFSNPALLVEAGSGCVALIKDADQSELSVFVADPQRQSSPIKLGIKTPLLNEVKAVTYVNPASPHQGKSLEFKVNSETPKYAGKDVLLDRSEWTIIASSEGPADATVAPEGDKPEYMIDGSNTTAFLFVKPSKTLGGVSVPAGTKPWFMVNLKEPSEMTYLLYRHRDYSNTTPQIRASKGSFYGKNTEEEEFTPIIENFDIATNVTEVRIDFPKVSCGYVKFVFEGWDAASGNTMQVSEFNLGNTLQPVEEGTSLPQTDVSGSRQLSLYPNPVKAGQPFFIRLGDTLSDADIAVYTLLGAKISESKAKDGLAGLTINERGAYIVKVKKNDSVYTAKVVVK